MVNIDNVLIIGGAIIGFLGGLSYLIETLKGKAKPNKVSWFLWSLAPLIAFAAEIQQGIRLEALMTFMVGFNPFLVFVASFVNKNSQWKIEKFDLACGSVSLLGLALWMITRTGNIAIMFSIAADIMACVPTFVKSFKHPESESPWIFFFGVVNALFTLLAIHTYDFGHLAFPLYIFIVDILLFIFIKFPLKTWLLRPHLSSS